MPHSRTDEEETMVRKAAPKSKKVAVRGGTALEVTLERLSGLAKKPIRPAPSQLAKVEAFLGSLPDDLRALWTLGGGLGVLGEPEGLSLLSPASAVSIARDLRKVGAPHHVLPIATDHAGNYACFDTARGRIVDWDHETRKVTAFAPSLAVFLEKYFVKPLARDAKDDAAIAKASRSEKATPKPLVATPKKVAVVRTPLVSKLDRPGYGGGTRSMVFVGDDRLALGFQNSVALVKLDGAHQDDLWSGGDGLAYDSRTDRLLAASWGVVALFDVVKKALVARFQADIGHGAVAVFSPDGTLAAIGDTSGWVNLFDTGKGKGIPKLSANERTPTYSLPKGKPVAQLEGGGIVHALAFRPDGACLAVASAEGTIRTWDVAKRSCTKTIRCKAGVLGIDFSRDGKALFAMLESGRVEVFDAKGKAMLGFTIPKTARSLRVLDNGSVAVLAPKCITIHDPDRGKVVAKAATKAGWPPRITDVRGSRIAIVKPAMVLEVR
jgi:hypothetical protein